MQLFTDRLSVYDLEQIAEALHIELYNYKDGGMRRRGKLAGRREHRFTLKPLTGHNEYRRPKAWAVSWAGHYVFMRAVYYLDPAAIIKTGLGVVTGSKAGVEYHGIMDFAAYATMTGDRNVGSMLESITYSESQHRDHIAWGTTTDLDCLAAEAAGTVATC